jgi:hypothetical protein
MQPRSARPAASRRARDRRHALRGALAFHHRRGSDARTQSRGAEAPARSRRVERATKQSTFFCKNVLHKLR